MLLCSHGNMLTVLWMVVGSSSGGGVGSGLRCLVLTEIVVLLRLVPPPSDCGDTLLFLGGFLVYFDVP